MASLDNEHPSPLSEEMQHHSPLKLTLGNVYQLSREIAQEMQRVTAGAASSRESSSPALKALAEKVVRALEWLEAYVEEAEELRTANCKLLLKSDELISEKLRRETLQQELKGMQLVAEERGRQRDALGLRIAELETQNTQYQERLDEFQQTRVQMLRKEKYSSPALTIDENASTVSGPPDYSSRSNSLDRRDSRKKKLGLTYGRGKDKDSNTIEQLQRELNHERKKLNELRESRGLEQRRVQQRLKHMEQEMSTLTKQLTTAQLHVEKLSEEKAALIERSEVLTEVKAITLATVARGNLLEEGNREMSFDESANDTAPKFYKKDILMILRDRNDLKEKVATLQDQLSSVKRRLAQYENDSQHSSHSCTPAHSRGHSPLNKKRSQMSTFDKHQVQHITARIEDSMVIVDVSDSISSQYLQLPAASSPVSLSSTPPNISRGSVHSLCSNHSNPNNTANEGLTHSDQQQPVDTRELELSTSI